MGVFFITASPQITPEEANLHRSYRTTLSQLCSSSVAPSILIVRGYDWFLALSASPIEWNPKPPSMFSPVPCIRHLWPSWTCGSGCAWRRSSCRPSLSSTSLCSTSHSSTSRLLLLFTLISLLLGQSRVWGNHHHHRITTATTNFL